MGNLDFFLTKICKKKREKSKKAKKKKAQRPGKLHSRDYRFAFFYFYFYFCLFGVDLSNCSDVII